jgi:hypothetical protein
MTAHLPSKGHLLTPALMEIQKTKANHLLQWHAKNRHKNMLFMGKKIFSIEEQYNNQYNMTHSQTSLEVSSEGAGGHHPSYNMVRWGVYHQGVTPLHFCKKRVKSVARVYHEDVLQGVVKPLNIAVFNGQKWVFQPDSAPARKAKTTQEVLWRNVLAFISTEDWPSGSPDLNPLDYKQWAVLEDRAC